MELRRYIDLFLRWWGLIALGTILAAGSAYIFSKRSVPVYQATTTLLVDQSKQVTTDYTSIMTSERLSQTYAEWLRKRPVLEEIIRRLDLNMTVDRLAGAIKVQPVRNTQLIVASVEDTSPQRAADITNLLPEVFREQSNAIQSQRFAAARVSVEDQLGQVRVDIARVQEAIKTAGGTGELDRLQGNLRELQTAETSLTKSLADIRLEEARTTDNLFTIERAEVPRSPIRPRTSQNTMLAAIVGAMLALGAVFLIEYLNDVLQNPDDVQSALGLTTLGAVPEIEGPLGEVVVLESGQSGAAESYRVLRTNLQFAAVDRPLHTLLVTSPSAGEGKTRTVANMGVALAQAGRSVVLVDADLHRPRLHRIFKLPNNTGLTTALVDGQMALDQLVQDTAVPGLRVLTSGPLPPNPGELLGTARMKTVLAELAERSDIVVLDSPPIMALSDTALLSTQTDGLLLVFYADRTRRELAKRALEALRQVQARVVGAVLNRVPARGRGYYYYYYHYYHYGAYYASGDGRDGDDPSKSRWRSLLRRKNSVAERPPVEKS
jgi:non-specific protein-tyrosine kinase